VEKCVFQIDAARRVGFLTRLESLRGVAALTVACGHCVYGPWRTEKPPLAEAGLFDLFALWVERSLQVLFNGLGAVNIFFVLSGFVLASSIARGPARVGPACYRFTVARFCRLFPAIWISVGIFALVWVVVQPEPDAGTILANMVLLNTSMNGVMWTLQIEVIAIPLVLVLGLMRRQWGAFPVIVAVGALFALSFVGGWTRGLGPNLSLNFLLGFALGMLACDAAGPVGRLSARQCALAFSLAMIAFFATRAILGNSTGDFRWITIVEFLAAATMIAIIAHRPQGRFAEPLDWPIMRFYGRISYSFYLFHPATMLLVLAYPEPVLAVVRSGVPAAVVVIALSLITIAAATPFAWLCWRHVETPGIALGRRLTGTPVQRPAEAVGV
jgi:peptidoglycan/LPS O-acetylase OafA/YrhL